MGEKRGMQALEAWCRQVTSGYNGVNVTNMTTSWKDGLAFCALVHHFRPDLIDFASLSAENVYHNNQLAFSVAENVLGIPALLDPEDMVNYNVPDRLSIMTYLSQFYQVLAAPKNKGGMAVGLGRPSVPDVPTLRDSPDSPSTSTKTPVKIFARQLVNSDDENSRTRTPGGRRASDVCVSCRQSVFLAERFMVNGRLHHRVCFRCARCQSQLSLANYYETEQEQYCCETCPDEVTSTSCVVVVNSVPPPPPPPPDETIADPESPPRTSEHEPTDPAVGVRQEIRSFLDGMVSDEVVPAAANREELPADESDPDDQNPVVSSTFSDGDDGVQLADDSQVDPEPPVDPVDPVDSNQLPDDSHEAEESGGEKSEEPEEKEMEGQPDELVSKPEENKEDESQPDGLVSSPVITVTQSQPEEQVVDGESSPVVPKPRRRKSKRLSAQTNADKSEYPEELNPFDDEPETTPSTSVPVPESSSAQETPKKLVPAPQSLNPFGSDDEDEEGTEEEKAIRPERPPPPKLVSPSASLRTSLHPSPSPKKRLAPPPPKPQRTPSLVSESLSIGSSSSTIRRKIAPPPPPPISPIPAPRLSIETPTPKPRHVSTGSNSSTPDKAAKELSNMNLKSSNGQNKDSHGQWKRKKGPAPPRPSPQKRKLRKLPLKEIQQELADIEVKQIELERQGVNVEQAIRNVTEPEDATAANEAGIHVEEMILRLFDLVNEKNELLRRQTELMYIRRQQRLEEEHAELEFQIRCLMDRPDGEKTDEDRLREEELIDRLVHVVHRRAEIVDCLEMDRRRQAEEDESIQQHLDVFNSRGGAGAAGSAGSETIDPSPPKTKSKGLKLIQSPIKLMKKDKLLRKSKKKNKSDADKADDADKETDDSDPAAAATSPTQQTAATSPPLRKDKSKKWFAK